MGAKTKVIITEGGKNEEKKNAAAENAVVITAVITDGAEETQERRGDIWMAATFRRTTTLEARCSVSPARGGRAEL